MDKGGQSDKLPIADLYIFSTGRPLHGKKNTASEFSNSLSRPILAGEGENSDAKWCVALRSVGLHPRVSNVDIGEDEPLFVVCTQKTYMRSVVRTQNSLLSRVHGRNRGALRRVKYYTAEQLLCALKIEFERVRACKFTFKSWHIESSGVYHWTLTWDGVGYAPVIFLHPVLAKILALLPGGWEYMPKQIPIQINGVQYEKARLFIKMEAGHSHARVRGFVKKVDTLDLPRFIDVQCKSIVPIQTSSGYSQSIGLVPFPKQSQEVRESGTEKYTFTHFDTPLKFVLPHSSILGLDFKLVDQNKKHIRLQNGTPTVIHLTLSRMNFVEPWHAVRFDSGQTPLASNNLPGRFTAHLQAPLVLNKSWRVALIDLCVSNEINRWPVQEKDRTITFKPSLGDDAILTFVIPGVYCETMYDIMRHVNWSCKQFLSIQLTFDERIELTVQRPGCLTLAKRLSRLLGAETDPRAGPGMGFSITSLVPYSKHRFLEHPNVFEFVPKFFLLFSNITQFTHVGSEYAQVLHVWANGSPEKSQGIQQIKASHHINYQALLHDVINSVKFDLRDENGSDIAFRLGAQATIVTLMFKRFNDQ